MGEGDLLQYVVYLLPTPVSLFSPSCPLPDGLTCGLPLISGPRSVNSYSVFPPSPFSLLMAYDLEVVRSI